MSAFKRKGEGSGFSSSEDSSDAERPDFSPLESQGDERVETGSGGAFRRAERGSSEATGGGSSGGFDKVPEEVAQPRSPSISSEEKPVAKKRYYNPGEVMRKRGCIGCGGMILGIPIVALLMLLAVIVL